MTETCKGTNCRRAANPSPATESHTCPFSVEVHDDKEFKCNCCEGCEQECRDDI